MQYFKEFHDGWFQGFWINEKQVYLFLATDRKERFVVVVEDIEALSVNGVKAGNIIFEVLTRDHEEILPEYIEILYELPPTPARGEEVKNLTARAIQGGFSLLEINPSYGATCLVLARAFRLVTYDKWLKECSDSRPAV
jgi:hypothetical protein